MVKKRSLVVLLAVVLAASSLVAVFSAPSGAQDVTASGWTSLPTSLSPPPPSTARPTGPLAASLRIHVDVTLKLPDPSLVTDFIASLSDRSSANYHRFVGRGQFGKRFGPSLTEVTAVDSALRSEGLDPGKVTSDRLSIPIDARASVLDRAFHVELVGYRLASGRIAYSTSSVPRISAAVAPYVEGVIGLSDLYVPESHIAHLLTPSRVRPYLRSESRSVTAGPKPCAAAAVVAQEWDSLTADQLASYYAMTPLYSLGDEGQGVKVAVAEFEPDSPSDIAAYQACYGTDATVNYIPIDGGIPAGPGEGEAALDIENVIGLAPRATLEVYQAPNTSVSGYDLYSTIADSDGANVVSTSWGECELDEGLAYVDSEHAIFDQLAAQGETVVAAAGDTGSTDCYGDPDTINGSALSVDDPGSQPYVVSVGGTSLGPSSETVWNDSSFSGGAGGGGVSSAWCMPSYQAKSGVPGVINSDSVTDPAVCGTTTPYLREVPDVSADADPETGYTTYYEGQWMAIGGTSAAAPLWAAVAALIDASPFCSYYGSNTHGDAGVLPQGLYAVAAAASPVAFYDVKTGNNDYTPTGYSGGLYSATTGYDMASGLGAPIVSGFAGVPFDSASSTFYPGLAALMCWTYRTKLGSNQISSVSPKSGRYNHTTTVTIKGAGFLPIAGADIVEFGKEKLTASCPTSSACTVVLPKSTVGTVNLRMIVEDLTTSPLTAADRFTYSKT